MATANPLKNGTVVSFRTSRMRKPSKGKIVGRYTNPHGEWLKVKVEDRAEPLAVRPKSCRPV